MFYKGTLAKCHKLACEKVVSMEAYF